ncbi:MAG: hypothetical protein IPK01_13295 [Acidobacteria bacterium]|nr:hypothetical protein [Acidobacteriota bacterium]
MTTSIFGADDGITGLAIQTDGKIVAAGYALQRCKLRFALARYNADGSLDTTFDTDGKSNHLDPRVDSFANAMRLQSTARSYLPAVHTTARITTPLARYNTDGSLDTTFDTDGIVTTPVLAGNDSANAVAIRSDGKIVAAGFAFSGAVSNFAILRYNGDGSLDNTFDTDGKLTTAILGVDDGVTGVALQTDNKIVAAGYAKSGRICISASPGTTVTDRSTTLSAATARTPIDTRRQRCGDSGRHPVERQDRRDRRCETTLWITTRRQFAGIQMVRLIRPLIPTARPHTILASRPTMSVTRQRSTAPAAL